MEKDRVVLIATSMFICLSISLCFALNPSSGNRAPVAEGQKVVLKEDRPKVIRLVARDKDGDPLTFSIVESPLHGSLSGSGDSWTYSPEPNYFGTDSFKFKASDGKSDSNVAKVSITVTPVNDPPIAYSSSIEVLEGDSVAIRLVASDVDGDKLSYKIVSKPLHGRLSGKAPNLIYTPDPGYTGSDELRFKANDGELSSEIATVSIRIKPSPAVGIISLVIDSPASGSRLRARHTMVKGRVRNLLGNETGVIVNGKAAMVYGDRFVSNHIPLEAGRINRIDVVAIDTEGNRAAVWVEVDVIKPEEYILIESSRQLGLSPLEIVLSVESSVDLKGITLSYSGPSGVEFLSREPGSYRLRLREEGVYEFSVATASLHRDSIGVVVLSRSWLDGHLRGKWESMRQRLGSGDVDGAVAFFSGFTRERYRELFSMLRSDLKEIVRDMADIRLRELRQDAAIYEIRTERQGRLYSYELLFVKDPDGIWRISSF